MQACVNIYCQLTADKTQCPLCLLGIQKPAEPIDLSDPEKLRALATWFDQYDDARGYFGYKEVQEDLRRMAKGLEQE